MKAGNKGDRAKLSSLMQQWRKEFREGGYALRYFPKKYLHYKVLLGELAEFANYSTCQTYVGRGRIARELGYGQNRDKVNNAIDDLEEWGFLKPVVIQTTQGKKPGWELTLPPRKTPKRSRIDYHVHSRTDYAT
jgi:hypothetical protein